MARKARVSVSTAARVLRDADYPVSPTLKKRVRRVADRMGYVPNLVARNLRRGDHFFVGLVAGYILDPYFGEIAEAVTEEATRKSLLAIVCNMQRDPRLEITLCQRLWEHRASGLILTGGSFDQCTHKEEFAALVEKMVRAGVIVVSLADRDIGVPTFSVDNELVGRTVAEHVLRLGHREIGVVIGPQSSLLTQGRVRGVQATLSKARIRPAKVHTDLGRTAGTAAVDRLLELKPGLTAIIAGTDTLALDAVKHLTSMGYRVPQDISVVGIGNTVYAHLSTPRLSTIDVSVAACSAAAVSYIAERLVGRMPVLPERFPVRLIEGETLGPCQQSGTGGDSTRHAGRIQRAAMPAEKPMGE